MGTKVESAKPYKIKPYLNSNKDPFGLTIKGNTKQYISAHKNVQDLVITGKNISTKEGKIKIIEASRGKGMLNAIVEVNMDDIDIGNVEMKIYDPSVDKKKGATIELRKLSDSDFEHVDKLKSIVCSLLDKSLNTDVSNQNSYFRAPGQKKRYVCDICSWETSFEQALKGHKKRMHVKSLNSNKTDTYNCEKCEFKTTSKATQMVHIRIKHKDETRKRQKDTFQCKWSKCESTFDSEDKLGEHMKTQHEENATKGLSETPSPSSSPPRKKIDQQIDVEVIKDEEMLDLDNLEIQIDQELDNNMKQKKRISELEIQVDKLKELEVVIEELLEERAKQEENKLKLEKMIMELKSQDKAVIPKHLSSVHPVHIPELKGYRMIYKTLGNGRCLENSIAVHLFENEDEGINVKKIVNEHIADNYENCYAERIPLPYRETIGVGINAKEIVKYTKEEMISFLRSSESLLAYSNSQELIAASNLFNMNIHVFTYSGKEGYWSEISPDPEMSSSAEMNCGVAPDLYLYHNLDSHYDLLVKEDSRLAQMGLIGNSPDANWKSFEMTKLSRKKAQKDEKNKEDLLLEDEVKESDEKEKMVEEKCLYNSKQSGFRRAGPQTYAECVKNGPQIFKCSKCDCELESTGLLSAHMQEHKAETNLCDKCGKIFSDRYQSKVHAQEHAKGEKYQCGICEKTFANKWEVETHVKGHVTKKNQCNICEEIFGSDLEVRAHIQSKHESNNKIDEWNCNDCPYQAMEPSELMKHLKVTKHQPSPIIKDKSKVFIDYKRCYTCNFEVDGYVNLMNHRKELHPSNKKCNKFPDGKCTRGKTCWYVHEEDLMDVDESFKKEDILHKCYICGEDFTTKDQLKKHKKREHPESTQNCEKFVANKCPRNDDQCWYKHNEEQEISKEHKSPLNTNQDFYEASQNMHPPDQIQELMEMMNNLRQKMEMMQKKLDILTT